MEEVLEIGLKTYFPTYKLSFKWEIENYSKLPEKWIKKSQDFSVGPESSWYFKFRKSADNIWLYLCRSKETNHYAECETLVLNCKNEVICKKNCSYKGSGEVDLLPSLSSNGFLENIPGDKIILKTLISVRNPEPSTVDVSLPRSAPLSEASMNGLQTLSADLKKLFDNNVKTDFTFNIGGETLSAHKVILVARSEVFARMFQEGMAEEANNVVCIEDIDLSTMKIFLSFMYSAELEECDVDSVLKVYQAADKYLVPDLKDVCVDSLAAKMTMDNVGKILYVAEIHHHEELKEKAMEFFARHLKLNQTVLREKS